MILILLECFIAKSAFSPTAFVAWSFFNPIIIPKATKSYGLLWYNQWFVSDDNNIFFPLVELTMIYAFDINYLLLFGS